MGEGPNYKLEIIRLKHALIQQEANLFRQTLDIAEALSRIEKATENRAAHERAIEDYEEKIAALEKTHGKHGEKEVLAAAESASEDE